MSGLVGLSPQQVHTVKTMTIGTLIGEGSEDGDHWGKWPGVRDLDKSLTVCGRWHSQPGISDACRGIVF